jgi:tetratricopeptide (TPR) repeat protein
MSGATGQQALDEARSSFEAGDPGRCLEVAVAALADRPDDVALLRLAGQAATDLGLDDGVAYLSKAAELAPSDADVWRDLGDALMFDGRLNEAGDAFRRALALRPDDTAALVDLGHTDYQSGRLEEAVEHLSQAAELDPGNAAALRGLVEAHRRGGNTELALASAVRVAELHPVDVVAAMDVAELSLDLGRLEEAVAAFARLRALDDEAEHDVYAYHGMIEAEIRQGNWRRALDLAVDATRVDRLGRTTDLLAFIVAQVFGEGENPAPSRGEVEETLARARAEHRLLHADAVVL